MPVRVLDAAGEGDATRHRRGHPLRRAPRREGHQPLPRVRLRRHGPRTSRRLLDADRLTPAARVARRRRVRQRGPRAASPTRRAPATCSRSARRPSTAACRSSPTAAAASTSSRPAAAPTPPSAGTPNCRPGDAAGRNIYQVTLLSRAIGTFGLPGTYEGTSMAVAARRRHRRAGHRHAACSGRNPTPAQIERQPQAHRARPRRARATTRATAAGLLDAAAADPARRLGRRRARPPRTRLTAVRWSG